MDHNYIEKFDLIDRYLMGKLAAEESAPFEEHFVDCPECIDRLKTTKDFLEDLRLVTVREASKSDNYRTAGLLSYISQASSRKRLALAVTCMLTVAIAGTFFVLNQMRRFRSEVNEAKSASAQWERRYEEEQRSASLSEQKREEIEQGLTEQVRKLEAKLQDEQKRSADMANEPGWWTRPGINVPVFALNSVRSGNQNSSETINELPLPRSPMGFVISLGLEGETKYKDYRITIFDDRNKSIWRRGGFKPDRHNSLSIGFNSSFFRPGKYLLKVEGIIKDADSRLIGNYPLRIIKNL
jgi:hypothetical protein